MKQRHEGVSYSMYMKDIETRRTEVVNAERFDRAMSRAMTPRTFEVVIPSCPATCNHLRKALGSSSLHYDGCTM